MADTAPKSNVVGLNSCATFTHPGNPNQDVIKTLEGLLQRAKDGEVIGVAWVANCWDDTTMDNIAGSVNVETLGCLHLVMSRMADYVNG